MGKSRVERREQSGLTVNLLSTNTDLGWRIVRQVPVAFALEQIALMRWREIWLEDGELFGVQPIKPEAKKVLGQVLIERLIAVTITNPELLRNAGLYGRSRTAGMPDWKRLRRMHRAEANHGKVVEPEDAIERAVEKVRQWPFPQSVIGETEEGKPIFGDLAVRVYPHPPQANPRKGPSRKPAAAPPA